MTCFEMFQNLAEHMSFNKQVLRDIQERKNWLEHKIADLRIKGFHRRAEKARETLRLIRDVEKAMERLVSGGE